MVFARLALLALAVLAMAAHPAAATVCDSVGSAKGSAKGCTCDGQKDDKTCRMKSGDKYYCGEDKFSHDCSDDFCKLKKTAGGSGDTSEKLLKARQSVRRDGLTGKGCNSGCGGTSILAWNKVTDTSNGFPNCYCKPTKTSGKICKIKYNEDYLAAEYKKTYYTPTNEEDDCAAYCQKKKWLGKTGPTPADTVCTNQRAFVAAEEAVVIAAAAVKAAPSTTNAEGIKLTKALTAKQKVVAGELNKCLNICVNNCQCGPGTVTTDTTGTTTTIPATAGERWEKLPKCTAAQDKAPKGPSGTATTCADCTVDSKGTDLCQSKAAMKKCKWVFNDAKFGSGSGTKNTDTNTKQMGWTKDNMPPSFTADKISFGRLSKNYKPYFCLTEKWWNDEYKSKTPAQQAVLETQMDPVCGPCVFTGKDAASSLCPCVMGLYQGLPIEVGQECKCGDKDVCGAGKFCYYSLSATRSCEDKKAAGLDAIANTQVLVGGTSILLPVLIGLIIATLIGSALAWKFRTQLCGLFKGTVHGTVNVTSGVVKTTTKTVTNPISH